MAREGMLGHLLLAVCPGPTVNWCQRGRSCAEPIPNPMLSITASPQGLSVCSGRCKVPAASTALPSREGKSGLEGRQVRSIPAATSLCRDNCLRVTAEVRQQWSVPISSLPTALPSTGVETGQEQPRGALHREDAERGAPKVVGPRVGAPLGSAAGQVPGQGLPG